MIDEEAEQKVHLVGGTSWATPKRWLVIMNLEARVILEEICGNPWGESRAWEM